MSDDTTTLEAVFGPVFPERRERLSKSTIIERSKIDPFPTDRDAAGQ